LFAGEPFDPATVLSFNRARWMDPASGRFLSVDPWGGVPALPASLFRYGYADGAPALLVDPSGHHFDLPSFGVALGTLGSTIRVLAFALPRLGAIAARGAALTTSRLTASIARILGAGGSAALPRGRDILEATVTTPNGVVGMIAEISARGTQLIVQNVAIYPAGAAALPRGQQLAAMLSARNDLVAAARELGFQTLRIVADRAAHSSSVTPGRVIDVIITL
jgi:RHS repeat-associated protein